MQARRGGGSVRFLTINIAGLLVGLPIHRSLSIREIAAFFKSGNALLSGTESV